MQGKRERPEDDEDPGGDQSRRKPDGQDPEADPDTDESAASEEEDDSEEEDSEDEEEFTLDEYGRVPGGILPHSACYPDLDYGYRCFPSFLDPAASDLAKLIADCRETFTARTTRKGQKYSAGETYWLAASAEPRCALEKLARDVFDLHTEGKEAGVDYDPGASGAEWWTLVLDSDDDVGLHWDRDYQMEASADILVHPHLSTVTYLTNVGGPTVVLGRISPMQSDDLGVIVGPINKAFLSRPAPGKHISFDGRMLHGAPADANIWKQTASAAGTADASRVTFLVNVWLNHVPSSAEAFPTDRIAQLAPKDLVLRKPGVKPVERDSTSLDVCSDSGSKVVEMSFVAGVPVALCLPLPVASLETSGGAKGSSTDGGTWILNFPVTEGPGGPEGICRISRK